MKQAYPDRRRFLNSTLSVLGIASLSGCAGNAAGGGSDPASLEQTFGFSSNFDKIVFANLGSVLSVTMEDDHKMDGFALAHESQTDKNSWIDNWEAPQFSGPANIAFFDVLRSQGVEYPNRQFKLIGFQGVAGTVFYVEKKVGSVTFTVPRSIAPPSLFEDVETDTQTP